MNKSRGKIMNNEYCISVQNKDFEKSEIYNVKILNSKEHIDDTKIPLRKALYFLKIFPLILILLLFVSTVILLFFIDKDISHFSIQTEATINEMLSVNISAENFEYIINTNQFMYNKCSLLSILFIAYSVILVFMIVISFVLYLKDDNLLKLAKLDELHEIKYKLIENVSNISSDKLTEISKYTRKSELKTIIKNSEKSNQADLLKHYMTCITEL